MEISTALEYFFGSYPVAGAVILVGVGILAWRVSARITKMQDKVDSIDRLPCSEHRESLTRHDGSISGIREDLSEVKTKVSFLVDAVNARQTKSVITSINDFSVKQSPRRLNDNGVRLFAEIDGDRFLNDNLSFFIGQIDRLAPKTALDVENSALAVLKINSNNDIFIPIKNWVYNAPAQTMYDSEGNPTGTKEVSLDDVLFVISLPLRDEYLRKHPELNS